MRIVDRWLVFLVALGYSCGSGNQDEGDSALSTTERRSASVKGLLMNAAFAGSTSAAI